MIQPPAKRDAISITVASVIVIVASFMPWAHLPGPTIGGGPFRVVPFPGLSVSMTMTVWNGNLRLLGIQIPHSIVVLIAVVLSVTAWLQANLVWSPPRALCLSLAGYAAFHSIWFIFPALGSGSLAIGSLLTAAAFVWMLVVLIRQVRQPASSLSDQSPESWSAN